MKFAILHHAVCDQSAFHYVIAADGAVDVRMPESQRGVHARAIGICVDGDFDVAAPAPVQMQALRRLLLELKLRYPDLGVGGHRQVRGDQTRCPGKHFPLTALRQWAQGDLIAARDDAIAELIARQYGGI